ncbi:endonuclease/exonuclease/phosphatase family protein [Marivita sp. GX14005]|uniref:endonuclease/exonuclease/phosphatase family protein n=1 Tax=Marivita sp. GX14005 TaxID=2942276 RepID=UPI0020196D05|nr:endonuclease/exonuclease/phosphatase family protein [Marivita sp. GX14005]MCL3881453.1 endonuclease/exonuclease/phosphatase family protein [Marivita sp. GX14005]
MIWETILSAFLWLVGGAVLIATLLPLTNSVRWWIRMWDFPRLHLAALALAVLLLGFAFAVPFYPVLMALMAGVLAYQAVLIFPYTPLARTEMAKKTAPPDTSEVRLLAANVQMGNDRYDDLAHIIERENPDAVLLMETDQDWADGLHDTLARYDTIKAHVSDNYYGMIFATRLKALDCDFIWPHGDDTPALKALLADNEGTYFNFIGLHPRPPVPGNTTKVRDRQIRKAAEMTASAERPTVCMGDFNDVAWSWTTQRFKHYGNFLEPRVGRGMVSSFHTKSRLLRLPIDQLFLTENVNLVSFGRLESFGSDHFPIQTSVFFDPSPGT